MYKRRRVLWVLLTVLLAGIVIFTGRYFAEGAKWALHSNNPRVYRRGGIPACGVLTDRAGILLRSYGADLFSMDEKLRRAVLHWTGDKQGNIPAAAVRGYIRQLTDYDEIDGLYRYGGGAARIRLTISSALQKAAAEAMGSYPGTFAMYNYKTGEIICAVSAPSFDPNSPPAIPENAVYVNRFTQGLYVPGSIFKVLTAAAVLESLEGIEDWHYTCRGSHAFGDKRVNCQRPHGELDLKNALMRSCNCAFAALSTELGGEALKSYGQKLGVLDKLSFDGITTPAGSLHLHGQASIDVAWSAIGQHRNVINPCSYLCFMGAIAAGGKGVYPYIVQSVGDGYTAKGKPMERILSESTAELLQAYLRYNVCSNYGQEHFGDFQVCAKTGTAEIGNGSTNALFTGFLLDKEYPYAFIIVAEGGSSGKKVCVPILAKVLSAIKNAPPA